MKKLNLINIFLVITLFSCTDDDSNTTNASLERSISKIGIHDIQTCSYEVNFFNEIRGDSLKLAYTNNKLSSVLGRTYVFNCFENDWSFADHDSWSVINFEYTENYLIINQVGTIALECPINSDGYITSIPQRQSDGSLGWDFEYSNGYLTKITINEYPDDYDIISTLSWVNENLISIDLNNQHPTLGNDNCNITYEYSDQLNKSKLFVGGLYALEDVYSILFLNCGRSSKNLPTQVFCQYYNQNGLTDSTKFEYDYILDNDGYVRFLTIKRTDINYDDWNDTYSAPSENIWTLELEYTN
jgi:hypothetical protein